jgi:hypothetical protein
MDKAQYLRLLNGEGQRYKNSDIYILPGSAKSTEERALTKIAPPAQLNPNYQTPCVVNRPRKVPRLEPQRQQQRRGRYTVDQQVLQRILNGGS